MSESSPDTQMQPSPPCSNISLLFHEAHDQHTSTERGASNIGKSRMAAADVQEDNEALDRDLTTSEDQKYILLYTTLDNSSNADFKSYTTKLGSISPKKSLNSAYICVGFVDANNEESFTLETFDAMITTSYLQNKVFILARVTTSDPTDTNRLYHSFYYGPQINRILFKTEEASGGGPAFLHRIQCKNPLNNMPIIGDVEYFIITPEDVEIARKYPDTGNDDSSYLKASLLDLTTYLSSEKNTSSSCAEDLNMLAHHTAILYRAHYLASDEDFLRCAELRSFFYQNSIYEDIALFEYQRPNDIQREPPYIAPFERYGYRSDGIILNPDRMIIDISTMHSPPSCLLCGTYFSSKSKEFRRNFFISILTLYLFTSLSLMIFVIPDSLKGVIGIAMVIGLCAILILFIENDRISQASSAAAAVLAATEMRRQTQYQVESQFYPPPAIRHQNAEPMVSRIGLQSISVN